MNKSLGMLFREYLADSTIGRGYLNSKTYSVFGILFAAQIIVCSEKRRNNESHEGLLREAVGEMVRERFNDFSVYISRHGNFGFERETLAKLVSDDLGQNYPALENYLRDALETRRDILFEESEFTVETSRGWIIEHPMMTFTRENNALDVYFSDKRVAKRDKALADLRVNLIYLLRAGNAVFQRHDWQPRTIVRETANE